MGSCQAPKDGSVMRMTHLQQKNTKVDNSPNFLDDMERLIYDTHRDVATMFPCDHEGVGEEANTEAKKIYRLVEEGNEELYPTCKTFSKLTFLICMFVFI